MITKILTIIFNCWFYLFRGCCHNCLYHDICKENNNVCSFIEDNDSLNFYEINKKSKEYKYLRNKFLNRFRHKKKRL